MALFFFLRGFPSYLSRSYDDIFVYFDKMVHYAPMIRNNGSLVSAFRFWVFGEFYFQWFSFHFISLYQDWFTLVQFPWNMCFVMPITINKKRLFAYMVAWPSLKEESRAETALLLKYHLQHITQGSHTCVLETQYLCLLAHCSNYCLNNFPACHNT